MAMQTCSNTKSERDLVLSLGNFEPSLWGFRFVSFSFPESEFESYSKEVESLREKVKHLFTQSAKDPIENIEFTYLLSRLALSYHFEDEIEEQLNYNFSIIHNMLNDNEYNLYQTALLFRVLRHYGYNISCAVFKKFKRNNGEFDKAISSDVKGILCLYEATFLKMHGEDILDEAVAFTRPILETFVASDQSSTSLAKHINNALSIPFHKGIEILEAGKYISFYEQAESLNETLLKFAKVNFNMLQLLYKQELALLTRWWKDLNLVERLPYGRERIVEGYFWVVAAHFEPCYALARKLMVKFGLLQALLDDTYDAHATLKEAHQLTVAFERWNVDASDNLPEHMKLLFLTFLNLFKETEINDNNDEGYSRSSHIKDRMKEWIQSDFIEAQWFHKSHVPSFDEYTSNALVSVGYLVLSAASFAGMKNIVGIEEYKWIQSNPKILQSVSLHFRLMNDLAGHKDKYQRERECAKSIECYVKEFKVSQKEAIEKIQEICENLWNDINEEYMKPSIISKNLLRYFVNLARAVNFLYLNDDLFTNPLLGFEEAIKLVFVQQFSV